MAKLRKHLKSRKASALIVVLFVFLFITIISTLVFRVYMTNLHQAKHQDFKIEAYYLAHSGIELGYSALMDLSDINDEFSCMLYEKFATNQGTQTNPDYKAKAERMEELDYELGHGRLDLIIESTKDANNRWWIEIKSKSTIERQLTKKMEINDEIILRFPFDNPLNKKWSKKSL